MEDRCVSCGSIIPEGRMICYKCERDVSNINISHMVLKYDDIDKYLTKTQLEQLTDIISSINNGRLSEKKRINKYIICNMDEPYSAAVLKIIKSWRKQDHVCQNCFCAKEDHNKEILCSNPLSDEFHNYVDDKFFCNFWMEE